MLRTERQLRGFWSKVEKRGPDECWQWLAYSDRGYGLFYIGRRLHKAHRISYAIHNGSLPADLMVRHRCDNRGCVNPKHLEIGTHADNMRDAAERDRTAHGTRNGSAKLTDANVVAIRQRLAAGERQSYLAAEFGIAKSTMTVLKQGRTWRRTHSAAPPADAGRPRPAAASVNPRTDAAPLTGASSGSYCRLAPKTPAAAEV
jgi:hypothetical protein